MPPKARQPTSGGFPCKDCTKVFPRQCDLNKHTKAHTRPYKCKVDGCKYATVGWPTQKELERHHNDKHNAAPLLYPCHFAGCDYKSKRESNCKQHMEKAHQWKYEKSKTKGRRSAQPNANGADDRPTPLVAAASGPPNFLPLNGDFNLFEDQDAPGEEDDIPYPEAQATIESESFVPWASPNTRIQQIQNVLDKTDEVTDGHESQADPMLSADTLDVFRTHERAGTVDGTTTSQVSVKSELPWTKDTDLFSKPFGPVDSFSAGPTASASWERSFTPQQPGHPNPVSFEPPASNRRELNENGAPPRKKIKTDPEGFSDQEMPDPFRYAHPHIYDKSRHHRYRPCHALHGEIASVKRHLKRSAHGLKVANGYISTFDMDRGCKYVRAGVCTKCWQIFHDRTTFETHISQPCAKVSKDEKKQWLILRDAFTPLVDNQQVEDLLQHPRAPPTSVPMPADFPNMLATQAGPVPEQLSLQAEPQALHDNEQVALFQALVSVLAVPNPNAAGPSTSHPQQHLKSDESPFDRKHESLLGLTNAHHKTDVDVNAPLTELEDEQRSLVRVNTGLTTATTSTSSHSSVSSIRRVPPSPPPKPVHLPAGVKEPRSIGADSGYGGTEMRRCSSAGMSAFGASGSTAVATWGYQPSVPVPMGLFGEQTEGVGQLPAGVYTDLWETNKVRAPTAGFLGDGTPEVDGQGQGQEQAYAYGHSYGYYPDVSQARAVDDGYVEDCAEKFFEDATAHLNVGSTGSTSGESQMSLSAAMMAMGAGVQNGTSSSGSAEYGDEYNY